MTQLTIATQSTVHSDIHCVNPECALPYPQKAGNKFCQSCGSPILLEDRYLPLWRLGYGGFAVTYTVYDTQTQQQRVLKVLTETSAKAVALFEQEAQVLSRLRHPGIPQVETVGSHFEILVEHPVPRALQCLVMEKINGHTLEEVLRQHPQGCSEAKVIHWFHQAIDILGLLHQQQIIHRDLKPANFMLRSNSGQLVVIDFGGAKQHQAAQPSSTRLISPGYSPPEQMIGSTVQPASDFYALGRTLIHLLTGHYPPNLEDPMTGELRWRAYAQVSDALADLLDEMVQFDVRQRPARADLIQSRLCQIAAPPSLLRSANRRQKGEARKKEGEAKIGNLKAKMAQLSAAKHPPLFAKRPISQTLLQPPGVAPAAPANRSPQPLQPSPQPPSQGQAAASASAKPGAVKQSGVEWFTNAVLDATWSAILAGVGGGLGTLLGFELGYRSPLGVHVSLSLWETLRTALPFLPLQLGAELLVFGAAGFGTALGLTLAGSYRQRRQPLVACLLGSIGYLCGLVGLRIGSLDGVLAGFVVFTELAAIFLTLGLGLPRPRWLYAGVAAIGTTMVLVSLAATNVWFMVDFWQFLYPEAAGIGASESSGFACLILFSLLGGVLSLCLGVSRYVLIPIFRWLS